jgi:carbonic anhydrase
VTEDVIRDVTFVALLAEKMFGDKAPIFEVAIIHHTECGARFLSDDSFRRNFADRIGVDEHQLATQAVTDPALSVEADVKVLLASSLPSNLVSVSGHVYDVTTGLVTTVVDPVTSSTKEPVASEQH